MNLAWKKSEPDLWNIYHLDLPTLQVLYPDCKHLRTTQLKYKREIDRGLIKMPEQHSFSGDLDAERQEIAKRRGRVASTAGRMVTFKVLAEHQHYYEKMREALETDGHPSRAIFYEMGYTTGVGDDKVADSHPLASIEVRFDSEKDAVLEALSKITPIKAPKVTRTRKEVLKAPTELRDDVLMGDPHFGYYRMPDGQLIPIHDELAIDIFHRACRDIQPEKIIIGGDLIDFAGLSHWEQLGSFIDTLNPTLERVATFLDTLRADCPNAKLILIEGNHDHRPTKARRISPQVAEMLKLTRPGEDDPVLSVQYLLDLKGRNVEFLRGGQARAEVNDRLGVMHKGQTNKKVGRDWRSTIGFDGHSVNTPRPEVITMPDGRVVTVIQHMLPMMGRVDGMLPSNSSTYDNYGRPDLGTMNWVQGFGVIEYLPGDAPFQVHTVFTNPHDGYKAFFRGNVYEPREL